jgi:hypothetical protein
LDRAALIVPAGYAGIALTGMALVATGLLNPTSSVVAWVLLTVAAWSFALIRGRVVEAARQASDAVRRTPVAFGLGLLVLAAFLLVRWTYGPGSGLFPTVLRYWVDGLEIADAGRVPARSLHWGIEVPPTISKVLLNTVYARSSYWLGRDPLAPMAANLFVVSVSLFLALAALLRRLGLRHLALPLALVLTAGPFLAPHTFSNDLRVMVAENWGRLIAVAALLPIAAALSTSDRSDRRSLAIVSGLLLGVTAATHLVAALAAAVVVVALGLGRLAVDRRAGAAARSVATAGGVSLALTAVVLLSAGGDLGFQGAGGDRAYRHVREAVGLPPSVDPVAFLTTEGDLARSMPVPYGPGEVLRAIPNKLVGREPLQGGAGALVAWIAFVVVGGLSLCLAWWGGAAELRALSIGAASAIALLLAIGVAFAVRYETFALANFGSRRLMQYFTFAGLLLVAAGLEAAMGLLSSRVAAGITIGLVVVLAVASLPRATAETSPTVTGDVAALAWIREHVPCEGRVLVNRRTLAIVQAFAGRAGVIEGMGPHVRPWLLTRALREMIAAKTFFSDPADGRAYLRERGIAAVVIAGGSGTRFAGWKHLDADPDELRSTPFLRPGYRSNDIDVFLVDGWERAEGTPRVAGRPGFGC